MIELCCEYLSVWCIWLYVLMSRTCFQSESTLCSCLNVKELIAWSRHKLWSLSDCDSSFALVWWSLPGITSESNECTINNKVSNIIHGCFKKIYKTKLSKQHTTFFDKPMFSSKNCLWRFRWHLSPSLENMDLS